MGSWNGFARELIDLINFLGFSIVLLSVFDWRFCQQVRCFFLMIGKEKFFQKFK